MSIFEWKKGLSEFGDNSQSLGLRCFSMWNLVKKIFSLNNFEKVLHVARTFFESKNQLLIPSEIEKMLMKLIKDK